MFAQPQPLVEGMAAVGDPIEVLPVALHALWAGLLVASSDVPLHARALVHSPWSLRIRAARLINRPPPSKAETLSIVAAADSSPPKRS
ncbi:hypothetical protein ACFVH0_00460 [Streptomyces sp. NPDC127117]|uniref:hypothetical protein n=1 Tax=Streptomyces sp. NPDC127117 TaxID=3345368 RepID=UPI003645071D